MNTIINITTYIAIIAAVFMSLYHLLRYIYITRNPVNLILGFTLAPLVFYTQDIAVWSIKNKEELITTTVLFLKENAYLIIVWTVVYVIFYLLFFKKDEILKRLG